jgi:hypothetical protein
MDPEPFLNDLGEQVGWVIPADDGQTYLCEFDGSVAAIWDDHEQDWDVDIEPGYTFADEDPYEERIAELEQRVNEPRPVSEVTVARAVEETDMERVNEDMMRQSRAGRADDRPPLYVARAAPDRGRDAQRGGGRTPAGHQRRDRAPRTARRGSARPRPREPARQAREARQKHMVECMQDDERIEASAYNGDDLLSDEPPATTDQYDVDDRGERQQWMADRLRGVTDTSALYSSDEDREETQEWSD